MKLHWSYCTLPLCVYPHPCLCGYKCVCDCTCTHAQGGCRPIWGIIPLVTQDRVCRWPWYIYLGWLSSRSRTCLYLLPLQQDCKHPSPVAFVHSSRDPAHALVLARHMASMPPVELSSLPPLFTKRCKITITNQLILGGQIRYDTIETVYGSCTPSHGPRWYKMCRNSHLVSIRVTTAMMRCLDQK